MIGATMFVSSILFAACGNDDPDVALDPSDYEIVANATATPWPTSTPVAIVPTREPQSERQIHVLSKNGSYTTENFEALSDFKLSKGYDVEGLTGADAAIYGFFGPDPYNRSEFEARLYPDHETALTLGVDFANEATGPYAEITSATQRWDEGLNQRRSCSANTRGSHHSGRCISAKYGDYVIAGNLVLLCQGRDSATALGNCEALYAALQ